MLMHLNKPVSTQDEFGWKNGSAQQWDRDLRDEANGLSHQQQQKFRSQRDGPQEKSPQGQCKNLGAKEVVFPPQQESWIWRSRLISPAAVQGPGRGGRLPHSPATDTPSGRGGGCSLIPMADPQSGS